MDENKPKKHMGIGKLGLGNFKSARHSGDIIKARQPMGIGKLGQPSTVFVRQFRWTLESPSGDFPAHIMKTAKFDFNRKRMDLEAYEVVTSGDDDIHIQKWLDSRIFTDKVLVFTAYDGCGNALYSYTFSNLTLLGDESQFDYSSSEASIRKISIGYQDIKREYLVNKPIGTNRKGWTLKLDSFREVSIGMKDRPQLMVEETQIDFLNAKTWIPGKAQWHPIRLTIDTQTRNALMSSLVASGFKTTDVFIGYYEDGRLTETWKLSITSLESVLEVQPDLYEVCLKINAAQYENKGINAN